MHELLDDLNIVNVWANFPSRLNQCPELQNYANNQNIVMKLNEINEKINYSLQSQMCYSQTPQDYMVDCTYR